MKRRLRSAASGGTGFPFRRGCSERFRRNRCRKWRTSSLPGRRHPHQKSLESTARPVRSSGTGRAVCTIARIVLVTGRLPSKTPFISRPWKKQKRQDTTLPETALADGGKTRRQCRSLPAETSNFLRGMATRSPAIGGTPPDSAVIPSASTRWSYGAASMRWRRRTRRSPPG